MQIPLIHQQLLISSEKLRELHHKMMLHPHVIPANEMEEYLSEIRSFYSTALDLQKHNSLAQLNSPQSSLVSTPTPDYNTPVVELNPVEAQMEKVVQNVEQVLKEASAPESKPVTKPSRCPEVLEGPVAEKKVEPSRLDTVTPTSASTAAVSGKKKVVADLNELYHESTTLGQTFSDHERLADRLGTKQQVTKRVSDIQKPVKDLKSAIGINEKFLFINHLFGGNAAAYNSAVEELEKCAGQDDAHALLEKFSAENSWEQHSSSAGSFIAIVDRRFNA